MRPICLIMGILFFLAGFCFGSSAGFEEKEKRIDDLVLVNFGDYSVLTTEEYAIKNDWDYIYHGIPNPEGPGGTDEQEQD